MNTSVDNLDVYTRNQVICEAFRSGHVKEAADIVDDYTKLKVTETGIARQIMTFRTDLTPRDFVRRLDTDKPYYIVDRAGDTPAAATVPFGEEPTQMIIRPERYPVYFNHLESPMAIKNVDELMTYRYDIRQYISDDFLRGILAEEDGRLFNTCDTILIAPGTSLPYSGVAQWQQLTGIDRDSMQDSFAIMSKTPTHLSPTRVVTNVVTIRSILKWGRDEFGGDKAQDLLIDGWTMETFMRAKWIITIKRDVVQDDTFYHFADEDYLGRAYEIYGPTMFVERKATMIHYYHYELIGMAIGNTTALSRSDHS